MQGECYLKMQMHHIDKVQIGWVKLIFEPWIWLLALDKDS